MVEYSERMKSMTGKLLSYFWSAIIKLYIAQISVTGDCLVSI